MIFKFLNLSNVLKLVSVLVLLGVTAFVTEPFLHYHNQQIGFNTGFSYLKSFLSYPGGIANYIAEFISQFFKFNIFGSVLIVLVATIQGIIALKMVHRIAGKTRLDFLIFSVVLVAGVIVLADYRYLYYATARLFLSFIFIWMFDFFDSRWPKISLFVAPVLTILLFYLASGAATIVFGASAALLFVGKRQNKWWWVALPAFLVFSGLIPYFSNQLIFPAVLKNLYRLTEIKPPEMLAYSTFYALYGYYLVLPVILLAAIFLIEVKRFNPAPKTVRGKAQKKKNNLSYLPVSEIVQVAFIATVAWFLFVKSFDPFKKKLVYLDYYAQNEQWNEILKLAETFDVYDFRVNYQVNRAYANLGTLGENLFNYPQLLGSNGLFLDTSTLNGSFTMPISDLYFDLGFMSESLHWAFEAQTLLPNSPRILKRIILIYIVNEKYELAQKFLNVLNKNMLYRDWVKKYQEYITNPGLAANDNLIAQKRQFSPKKAEINLGPFPNLRLLIDTNHNNRMAFDYMVTLCILDFYSVDFINYISQYSYYGTKKLPRAWGEALSFYIVKNKSVPAFVTGETVNKADVERMKAFNAGMVKYGKNIEQAKAALRGNFENTFWYYMVFLNPKVTNALENKGLIK
jgi:hypothetical protein